MQQFFDTVGAIDDEGDVIVLVGASVTVYDAGTANVASIYSDDGVTVKDNPFLSGEEGQISFYAADGRYDIYVHLSPYKPVKILDILLEDPTTSSSGEMSTHLSTFTHSDISVNKSSITSLGVVDSQNKSLSDSADISLATRDSQNTSIITSASLSLTTKDSQNLSVAISADLSAITRLSGVDSTLSSACDSNIVRFSSSNSALSSSDNSIVTELSTADSTVLSTAMSAADSASSGGSDDSVAQSMATSVATQDSIATSQANSADLSITSRLSSADSIILSTASSNTDSADTSVVTRLSSIDSSVLSTAVSAADSVAAADSDDSVAQSMATSVATQESTTTSQALSANTSIISQLSTVDSSDSSIALSAAQSAANLASGGAVDDVARDNIVLNAWRIAIDGGLARFNLEDGVVDEFEDETGVDTTASTNESYNSSDDYYSPVAGVVIDNMEYATDSAAQTAYVTNAALTQIDHATGSNIGDMTYREGVAAAFDGNTDQAQAASAGSDIMLLAHGYVGKDWGSGVSRIISQYKIYGANDAGYDNGNVAETNTITIKLYGSNSSPADGTDGTLLHTASFINDSYSTNPKTYSTGITTTTAYRYHWVYMTVSNASLARNALLAEVEFFSYALQSYSESTIKTQGSYSLKGVATTSALNKTLTRTIGSPIDLSGVDTLYFYIRSNRTGSNIKIGIHDSGGTTTESTPNITDADTFQKVTIDLSGVADANKDAIDSLIVTIVNADSANTFYMDGFSGPPANMTLISEPSEAEAEPTNARLIILAEPVDSITINTDLKGYVSLDDGSNFEQVTLVDQGNFDTAKHIYAGSEDLTDRDDKTMVWKIETANNKSVKIHAVGLLWK